MHVTIQRYYEAAPTPHVRYRATIRVEFTPDEQAQVAAYGVDPLMARLENIHAGGANHAYLDLTGPIGLEIAQRNVYSALNALEVLKAALCELTDYWNAARLFNATEVLEID